MYHTGELSIVLDKKCHIYVKAMSIKYLESFTNKDPNISPRLPINVVLIWDYLKTRNSIFSRDKICPIIAYKL